VTGADIRDQERPHASRPGHERTRLEGSRRAPLFAAGFLPLAALSALVIGVLLALTSPPDADVSLPPAHQERTQTAVFVPSHLSPNARTGARGRGRTPPSSVTTPTPSLVSAASRPAERDRNEAPKPGPPRPQPTPSPAPPPAAEPVAEPPTPSEPAATAAPLVLAPTPAPALEIPPAPQPADQASKPGWGCGDENHGHTGPPAKPNGSSPCDAVNRP
jgi:hypothetical protein